MRRTACKSYTGCWTCRERRVKCDEARPACKRCAASSRACKGYAPRLSWSLGPRHIVIVPPEPKMARGLSPSGIKKCLRQTRRSCLQEEEDAESESRGPFSVFRAAPTVYKSKKSCAKDQSSLTSSTTEVRFDWETFVFEDKESPTISSSPSSLSSQLWPHLCSIVDVGHATPLTTTADIPMPEGSEDTGSGCFETPPSLPDEFMKYDLRSWTISSSIPVSYGRLIHHWITFLCRAMVSVDEVRNHCRQRVVTLALESVSFDGQGISGQVSPLSIFHGMCASAAHNLFNLTRLEHYQMVALQHEQQQMTFLRQALLHNATEAPNIQKLLYAIILRTIVESISGRTASWRHHALAGINIAVRCALASDAAISVVDCDAARMLLCMAVFGNLNIPVSTLQQLQWLSTGASELEFCHGLNMSTLELVMKINVLTRSKSPATGEEVQNLEDQINKLDVEAAEKSASATEDPKAMKLATVSALYGLATRIHFEQSIKKTSPESLQHLAELAIGTLEAIESYEVVSDGCVLMWPCIVVACLCRRATLQQQMLRWFALKRHLGLQSVTVVESIAKLAWAQYGAEGQACNVAWQDLVEPVENDVLLL